MIPTQEWCTCPFPAMSLPGLGFRITLASWSWKAFPLPLSQIFLVPSLLFAVLVICLTVLIMSETKPRCLQPLKGMHKAKTTFSPTRCREKQWYPVPLNESLFFLCIYNTNTKPLGVFLSPSKVARFPWRGRSEHGLQHPLFILICHFYWYGGAHTKGSYFKCLLLLVTVHCCSYRRCVYGFLHINSEQMKI